MTITFDRLDAEGFARALAANEAEHRADEYERRGQLVAARGARGNADHLWRLAFLRLGNGGGWLDRRKVKP